MLIPNNLTSLSTIDTRKQPPNAHVHVAQIKGKFQLDRGLSLHIHA